MGMDERISRFRGRPMVWDKVYNFHLKLIFDLIDDRNQLKTLLASREARIGVLTVAGAAAVMVAEERGGATEKEERLSKDRVPG